jgi:hypothetical protein
VTDIVIKSGDTPSKFATAYVGNANKWPEFCKANPQFKPHATYGCVFYPGNVAHLPATWPATPGGAPPAPMPGPVPQPVGPPIPTPGPDVITPGAPDAPSSSSSLLAGLDPTKVMIGGAVVAGAIVLLYAMKKKSKTAAA